MKFRLLVMFFSLALCNQAQNVQFVKSVFSEQGPAGIMLTPNLKLENKGSSTEEIKIKRVNVNLPLNWYTCFCYLECQPPALDTLNFFMAPGEIVDIGIGFGTDSIEGLGKVKIELYQAGSNHRDTLEFTGSTIMSSVTENFQTLTSIFPNPAHDYVTVKSEKNLKSILVLGAGGNNLLKITASGKQYTLPTGNLSPAVYFLIITDDQNRSRKVPLIIR